MMMGVLVISAMTVQAAGFAISEESARGNAMQSTLVGSTKDVSAIFYNPANLTELDNGVHAMFGVTFARPDYYTDAMGKCTDQHEHVYELPHFYVAAPVTDDVYLGFGEYTEFGLGTCYENKTKWPLAADSCKTEMYCFTFSPVVGWQVTERLSLGAGLRVLYMNLLNDRMIPAYNSYFKLDVEDWAAGYLAAAAYQLTDTLRLGLVYRSQADFHEEGDVELSSLGMKTGVKGDLSMPQSVMIGINWQVTKKLELAFNTTWSDWSVVKSLDMDFESPAIPDQRAPQNWHDTWRYSVGAEYKLNDAWAVQCGYTYDLDPTDAGYANTMCPPGNREQYGIGCSYGRNNWKIAVDYMYVDIHDTNRSIHGADVHYHDLKTDTLGLSFSYDF